MFLPSSETLEWIQKISCDPELIGKDAMTWRKRAQKEGINLPPELGGLGRGIQKINSKTNDETILLATSEMAEMATHWSVAKQRFSRIPQDVTQTIKQVVIPACGAGLDAINLRRVLPEASFSISDLSAFSSWVCRENFKRSFDNLKQVYFSSQDALHPSQKPLEPCYAFLDPARRQAGKRLNEQYLPDLNDCIRLLEQLTFAQIKLSPGENIYELLEQYPNWSWEVIQQAGEVKEINGSFGFQFPLVQVTQLDHTGQLVSSYGGEPESPSLQPYHELPLGNYIAVPEAGLRQSGLITSWSKEHQLSPTMYNHIYHSEKAVQVPLAKIYQIEHICAIKAPALKKVLSNYACRIELKSLGVKPDQKILKLIQPFSSRPMQNEVFVLLLVKSQNQQHALLLKEMKDIPS